MIDQLDAFTPPIDRAKPRTRETGHLPAPVIAALDEAFASVPVGETLTAETLADKLTMAQREILRHPLYHFGLGGYWQQKKKAGRIKAEGFTTAQRDDARGRPIKLWRKVAA